MGRGLVALSFPTWYSSTACSSPYGVSMKGTKDVSPWIVTHSFPTCMDFSFFESLDNKRNVNLSLKLGFVCLTFNGVFLFKINPKSCRS